MGFSLEGLDLKKEIKELKPTSRCFKDYINSLKKTGNCEPVTVNGYQPRNKYLLWPRKEKTKKRGNSEKKPTAGMYQECC
jgi:hypothetical protein